MEESLMFKGKAQPNRLAEIDDPREKGWRDMSQSSKNSLMKSTRKGVGEKRGRDIFRSGFHLPAPGGGLQSIGA